ncbi:MAG: RNA polymerase sigma factor [Planctomycetota bacterium]
MAKINHPNNSVKADSFEDGDRMTPESLIQNHASAVMGVCLANTKNVHDAEDVMQEVFVKAISKFNTLRDPNKARAWLMQITRRMCIDSHRKQRPISQIDNDIPGRPDNKDERIARLQAAISKLPEDYRETISLYYLDGRKCSGVAESLGISEVAVRQRLVRARLMLHDLLVEDEQ